MEKELTKLFKKATYENTDENLSENIWRTITVRKERSSRIKMFIFSLAGIASLAGLVPAVKVLLQDLSSSGIYEYVSLAFSNNNMASYWKDIVLSIAESLPTMSILTSLSLIFAFIFFARFAAKQIRNPIRLSGGRNGTLLIMSL